MTRTRAIGLFVTVLGALLIQAPRSRADQPSASRLGLNHKAELLEFKDIRYLPRTLDDFGAKSAFAIIFISPECPIAQRYLPKLNALSERFKSQGVQFLALYAGAKGSVAEMAEHALEHQVPFPVGRDFNARCAKALGVQRTPEAVVLDRDRKLRYRGRIDDQFRLGGDRAAPIREDLREAIEDVLADREVRAPETVVDGCKIAMPAPTEPGPVAYFKDVLPILRKHCQECHRKGGDAPFALDSFADALQQSEMIAETVAEERMPPWHGSRRFTEIVNARGLSDDEKQVLIDWARRGAPKGDPRDLPPAAPPPLPPKTNSWRIGQPDLITTQLFEHSLPAAGSLDYRYVILPHVFTDDVWAQAIEILPDNPRVVHHCNLAYAQIGGKFSNENFITGRVPGGDPMVIDEGTAFLIPKGSILALQVHYVTTGRPERSKISVGLRFPRSKVVKRLHHIQVNTSRFEIPPYAEAHPVAAKRRLPFDAVAVGLFSHMHVRGKDMTFMARKPDGSLETLLVIPNYNFDWQQSYRWKPGTKTFPAGTTFEVLAHYDNSAFNPYNPDPAKAVRYGDQTFHEMMFGFYFFTRSGESLNLTIDPKTGRALPAPASSTAPSVRGN